MLFCYNQPNVKLTISVVDVSIGLQISQPCTTNEGVSGAAPKRPKVVNIVVEQRVTCTTVRSENRV